MAEAYPNQTTWIGDRYALKEGVKVDQRDVLAKTGNSIGRKLEVDKMGASYKTSDVVGVSNNQIDKTEGNYPHEEITVGVHGPLNVKVAKDVVGGNKLMGASNRITELFDGDGTAQQEIYVGNVPVDVVVSVTEDPTGTPTVLTQVSGTPGTNEYSINKATGKIIIGGTSVSGTDNYEVVYDIDSGRLEPLIAEVTESIAVSTNVGALSQPIDFPLIVNATTGSSTGIKTPIYSGTPSAGEVLVDRDNQQLEFASADAITAADVIYKTSNKACATALDSKSAGELCPVFFTGVES